MQLSLLTRRKICAFVHVALFTTMSLATLDSRVHAQLKIEVVGGPTTTQTAQNFATGNIYRMERTVLLRKLEVRVDFSTRETLTFYRYRYHSARGSYVLDWKKDVTVTGKGRDWYSSGNINLALLDGNHYLLGVRISGSVKYEFNLFGKEDPTSFGAWVSGGFPGGSLPMSKSLYKQRDLAQMHQRITTIGYPRVTAKGTPCSFGVATRLVASEIAEPSGKIALDVLGPALRPAILIYMAGPTLQTSLPLLGCELWLNPASSVLLTVAATPPASGHVNVALPVPANQSLSGFKLSCQALSLQALGTTLSTAVDFTL